MSKSIDQMLEEVETIPLPRKNEIIKILLDGKKSIDHMDKDDSDYYMTYEEQIAQQLQYYENKVRVWRDTEFRHLKNGYALRLQIKKERAIKKINKLQKTLQECTHLEKFSNIEEEIKILTNSLGIK